MRKNTFFPNIVIIFTIIVSVYFGTPIIYAQSIDSSGACSSHLGVDCSAGAGPGGSVICKDDWVDSSVQFSTVEMCVGQPIDLVRNASVYGPLIVDNVAKEYAKGVSSCGNMLVWVDTLKSIIKQYQDQVADYQKEIDSATEPALVLVDHQAQIPYKGAIVIYQLSLDTIESEYYIPLCAKQALTCQTNSTLNTTDNKCYCNSGYLWSSTKNSCITATASCQESYGLNSYATTKNADGTYGCQCKDGYTWNDNQTSCLKSTSNNTSIFTDVNDSTPYKDSISYLKQQSIITGYSDGSFKPNNTINRAELIKIIIGAKYSTVDDTFNSNCFKDVLKDQWYTKFICFAKDKKIISGYSDGTFKPGQSVNYAEALKMLLEAYGLVPQKTDPWYQGYIDLATNNNIYIPSIGISSALKRGEMAELMTKTINSTNSK